MKEGGDCGCEGEGEECDDGEADDDKGARGRAFREGGGGRARMLGAFGEGDGCVIGGVVPGRCCAALDGRRGIQN